MDYVHVLKNGIRVTSIPIDILTTKDAALEKAKALYADCDCIIGDDDILQSFIVGKIYKDGQIQDAPIVELTAAEKKAAAIATIKASHQAKLNALKEAYVTAALMGSDTTKLSDAYKAELVTMTAEIKGA